MFERGFLDVIAFWYAFFGWEIGPGTGETPEQFCERTDAAIVWRYDAEAQDDDGWLAFLCGELSFLSDDDFGPYMDPNQTYWWD